MGPIAKQQDDLGEQDVTELGVQETLSPGYGGGGGAHTPITSHRGVPKSL